MYRCGHYWYRERKAGTPIDGIEKGICGGFFLSLIFLLLVAPLYLFSDMGTSINPVIAASLSVSMEINNKDGMRSSLPLFETENA
jgi:hypothetical protein